MKVLVITPTFGRLPFLGRLVASFLSQTYDDKELVIINDDKNVKIACDINNVKCINIDKKILVGQKRNLATQLGYYDLYMHIDDDDVFLPERISNHVKMHQDRPEINLYRNTASYRIYGDAFERAGVDAGMNFISYKRQAWFDVGGCFKDNNLGEDREFLEKMPNVLQFENFDQLDCVYNFGGINYHLSVKTPEEELQRIAHIQRESLNLVNGVFNIVPDFTEYNKFIELDKRYKAINTNETNSNFFEDKILDIIGKEEDNKYDKVKKVIKIMIEIDMGER